MRKVAITKVNSKCYPHKENLFRPDCKYPEYMFEEVSENRNDVYSAVRNAFHILGYDDHHYDTPDWNPLQNFVKEGDLVVIKPNLVQHYNCNRKGGLECLYTNASLVAPVIDYVLIALKGTGKIIVGDAPIQESDFNALVSESGYLNLIKYYKNKGVDIELVDFRRDLAKVEHRIYKRTERNSAEYINVNLGKDSEFYGDDSTYVSINYSVEELNRHHKGVVHEYAIAKAVLQADVIINMPKIKTHKKAGITAALKNIVGTCAKKGYLPHHTFGAAEDGGDEYEKHNPVELLRSSMYVKRYEFEEKREYAKAKLMWCLTSILSIPLKLIGHKNGGGGWYGNRTISRTVCDLNKIIFYADKNGQMREEMQRKYLIVSDMVVAGQGNGPVAPYPKRTGVVIVSNNPIDHDRIVASMMGFDENKIPTLLCLRDSKTMYEIDGKKDEDLIVCSDIHKINEKRLISLKKMNVWSFKPPKGWENKIEL